MATKRTPQASTPAPARKARVSASARPASTRPRSLPVDPPEFEDEGEPDQPFAEGALDGIDPDLRHRMISEAAYRYYCERGYTDGYDMDDWLQAEAAIDHLLLNPREHTGARSGE
jgi:hypothetical protein